VISVIWSGTCGPNNPIENQIEHDHAHKHDCHDHVLARLIYNTGERYLTTKGLFPADNVETAP